MIATWLQRHLEDRGLWDSDGITRATRARRCRSCRAYVLAGLDSDQCALPVAVDIDPLNRLGEAAALIAGRTTYSLRFRSGRLELDHRGQFEIRGEAQRNLTGGQLRRDVLPAHVCGMPSLGAAAQLGEPTRLSAGCGFFLTYGEPPF